MNRIEPAASASYYRLHQRVALVALLTNEIQKQQQQQSLFEDIPFFRNVIVRLNCNFISLGTFSCDSLSCVSSNNGHSKKKHRHIDDNTNNNNNTLAAQAADEQQNHYLEFYVFDITQERHLYLTNDLQDERLIVFYKISDRLYHIGVRNGK